MENISKSSHTCYFIVGLIVALVLGMGMLSSSSLAGPKRIVYTFEMKVQLSDVIVLGEIKEINRQWIFFREAVVEPLSVLKGKAGPSRINVKLDSIKVEVGRRYFWFLISDGSSYKLTGGSISIYPVLDNGYVRNISGQFPHNDIVSVDAFTIKIKEQLERPRAK